MSMKTTVRGTVKQNTEFFNTGWQPCDKWLDAQTSADLSVPHVPNSADKNGPSFCWAGWDRVPRGTSAHERIGRKIQTKAILLHIRVERDAEKAGPAGEPPAGDPVPPMTGNMMIRFSLIKDKQPSGFNHAGYDNGTNAAHGRLPGDVFYVGQAGSVVTAYMDSSKPRYVELWTHTYVQQQNAVFTFVDQSGYVKTDHLITAEVDLNDVVTYGTPSTTQGLPGTDPEVQYSNGYYLVWNAEGDPGPGVGDGYKIECTTRLIYIDQ